MQCKYDLLIIGDAVFDIYLNINAFPILSNTTIISDNMQMSPGGPAAMAMIASKLGLKVAFYDKIGNDIFGNYLKRELNRSGVDTQHLLIDKNASTAISINLIDADKNHSFIGYLGAGDSIPNLDENIIINSRSIFIEGYNLTKFSKTYDTIFNSVKTAKFYRKHVFFDPGPLISEINAIDKFINNSDTIFLNNEEALNYSKLDLTEMLDYLKKDNKRDYVVKLGREGSVLTSRGKIFSHSSSKIEDIKSTIGAGDAFDVGYITAILKGYDKNIACMSGNMVAALRLKNGIKSIPDISRVIEFINGNKM